MKKRPTKSVHKHTIIIVAIAALIAVIVLWVYTESGGWRSETSRQENIHYCNTPDKQQTLDLYRPEDASNQTLPVVVYVHGGGWRWGGKNNAMINNYGPIFIKHNLAVAALSYRLNPLQPYPDQNEDVACAISYITINAAQLHIDATKMIFMGESAGGELATFAALNPSYKGTHSPAPIGVIDFYGVSDFAKIINSAHPDLNARRYLGPSYMQLATEASPITYVSKEAPQFLIIHGESDKTVPLQQSSILHSALTRAGAKSTYRTIPRAAHGFVGPELRPSSYKIVLDSLNTFLQEVVGR